MVAGIKPNFIYGTGMLGSCIFNMQILISSPSVHFPGILVAYEIDLLKSFEAPSPRSFAARQFLWPKNVKQEEQPKQKQEIQQTTTKSSGKN
jgi:hypothetical protein